jgi:PAS domain S-box-containing protein
VTGNPDHLTLFFPPMDKYFEISVAPWGESGFATIFSDVTGRKRAMEALQASEQRLSSVVSNLAVVLYALDENGIFLLSEGKGLAMLGLQPGEVVGRSAIEMYAPFAEVSQGLARALAGESFMHVAPLGDFWFEIWYSPVRDPAGRLAGTIGVAFDISDRIRLDQEREILIRELETKNAELERFTYTVSHDLKSPLITIKGFVGMLDADMREGNAELAAKDMQRIAAAADRMQNLLEDLLELSRIGRIVNPPSLFRMDEPLREALEMLDGVTRERQVVLDIVGQWPEVEADRVRIREVWQNLVENSVKYMGDQPAPRIVVGSRVENGEKCFFVGDNGIGIAEQYRERVFRLFEKLDPASEGTGIGLALVARIIDLHGGRVWIEAGQEGVGTTVWFSIGS